MEKEALKAWNADMLIDIFPQKEEFEKEKLFTALVFDTAG